MLSVAVKLVRVTVKEFAVAGRLNAVTTGGTESVRVMVTAALRLADTFAAASLAQA